MTPWLVVPSRGDHPEFLAALVALGYPTVIVVTGDGVVVPTGAHALYDTRKPLNIHRWWNAGLDYAAEQGARVAVVVNDDVTLHPDAPQQMADRLIADEAWLCAARPTGRTGWCWALDLAGDLRPDERFRWWYGDDDLWLRADLAGKLTGADAEHTHHHPNEATAKSDELAALVREDEAEFRRKWGLT